VKRVTIRKKNQALAIASRGIDALPTAGAVLTARDRARVLRALRAPARYLFSLPSKPERRLGRPYRWTATNLAAYAVAWLVDRYGVDVDDAIRAIEPAARFPGATELGKLRRAYGRLRQRGAQPDPCLILAWLDARRSKK